MAVGRTMSPSAIIAAAAPDAPGAQESLPARARGLAGALRAVMDWNAGNLAEAVALREALARLDPTHPLLDPEVQDCLKAVGRKALASTGDWDDVRRAAKNFLVDNLPP